MQLAGFRAAVRLSSNQCNTSLDKDESRDGAGSTWREGYAGGGTTDGAQSVSVVQEGVVRWQEEDEAFLGEEIRSEAPGDVQLSMLACNGR